MAMYGAHCNLGYGQDDAEGGQKSFRALPILLVPLHAMFQLGDTAAIPVAHQAIHLRLQEIQIAEHLRFEFVHHSHL
jgi:hypothetical protein